MKFIHSFLLSVFTCASLSFASPYILSDNVVGFDFYQYFDWEAIPDPTEGRVNYVDQATSIKQNLTFASDDTFILRTDFHNVLKPDGPGRNSVRIRSKKTFTTHVAIFDVRHMPQGCGTWPAIWETKESGWPQGGEIDILEGVNDQGPNRATLHTSPGCQMPPQLLRFQTGEAIASNCDTTINGNAGCSVVFPTNQSYGPTLNDEGGGWFAIERTDTDISVWFWSRYSLFVPFEVKEGSNTVDPLTWGFPAAHFPNTFCDLASHFSEENIIINLTLCGGWAGSVYQDSGCPSTCIDHVNNNPASFKNAYFDFASIRTFTAGNPFTPWSSLPPPTSSSSNSKKRHRGRSSSH